MDRGCTLLCSHQPAFGPCRETENAVHSLQSFFINLTSLSSYHQGLPSHLFFSGVPIKVNIRFHKQCNGAWLSHCITFHAIFPIMFLFVWSRPIWMNVEDWGNCIMKPVSCWQETEWGFWRTSIFLFLYLCIVNFWYDAAHELQIIQLWTALTPRSKDTSFIPGTVTSWGCDTCVSHIWQRYCRFQNVSALYDKVCSF
jgi:hypothetical protein